MRNWWDQRSKERQTSTALPGKNKPSWRWHGHGVYEYTTSSEAAAYVRQFAAMKAAKEARRNQPVIVPPVLGKTPTMMLIEAASRVPARAVA